MIQRHFIRVFILGFMMIAYTACVSDTKNPSETNVTKDDVDEPTTQRKIPKFDRDSAYAYVAKQVSFGPRVPNTDAHKACKTWLSAKLKEFGATVIEQDFTATAYTGTVFNSTNIIGQFNPDRKRRILLGAHWDSRMMADKDDERQDEAIDGADDGASGVGALLEIARQINKNGIDIGIDIIFFDAEDNGEDNGENSYSWCLGSQYWAKNTHVKDYDAMYGILLDMVGAKDARFAQEDLSMQIHPQLVNKIWDLAASMKQGKYFVKAKGGGVTDDHVFVSRGTGIPMIDIINLPGGTKTFGHYHHTHDDNMDIIDKNTLYAAGQVVLAVLYRQNNGTF